MLYHIQRANDNVADLIGDFLAGKPEARSALPRDLRDPLLKMAGQVAPDLRVRGLEQDVVQEMFRLLLSRPAGHYVPQRGTGWAYLRTMLKLAARDVRAMEAPAGGPRRPRKTDNGGFACVQSEPLDETGARGPVTERQEDCVVARIAIAQFIDGMPPCAPAWLPRALILISEGLTVTETARALEISRFTLRRSLDRWAKPRAAVLR